MSSERKQNNNKGVFTPFTRTVTQREASTQREVVSEIFRSLNSVREVEPESDKDA